MAAYYSVQETNRLSVPVVRQTPTDYYGRRRVNTFEYTAPAGINVNDTLALTDLPVGSKILGGKIAFSAAGAGATLSIGTAASGQSARYLSAGAIANAGNSTYADQIATNINDILTAETQIIATFGGAGPATGTVIKGSIDYVVD